MTRSSISAARGDTLVAELPAKGAAGKFAGVLALGDGAGSSSAPRRGRCPQGGSPLGELGVEALLLGRARRHCRRHAAQPDALRLPDPGAEGAALVPRRRRVRAKRGRDALAYTAGAIVGTGALGAALLAIRAAGSEAGWAFQLQDPRTIMLLLLLAVAITANLLGLFELPVLGGARSPAGSFGTGALAAFVATPCAGPFLGAALGTALLLPLAGSVLVFAALGLGLALPFLLVAFVPRCARGCRSPGRWMDRLQRFLAIPMAASAVAALWLLYRQAGIRRCCSALSRRRARCLPALRRPHCQRAARRRGILRHLRAGRRGRRRCAVSPAHRHAQSASRGAEPWSEARVAERYVAARPSGVRLFHRRLVPDLQGQRGRGDRPRRGPRRVPARRA